MLNFRPKHETHAQCTFKLNLSIVRFQCITQQKCFAVLVQHLSRLYVSSVGLYKPLVKLQSTCNAMNQILTPHIQVTAEPILIKLETQNYHPKGIHHAKLGKLNLQDWKMTKQNISFVHPHLIHGIEIYANTSLVHISEILTLNNKILRILQNQPYNSAVKDLYVEYNTLPIHQLHIQQLAYFQFTNLFTTGIYFLLFSIIIFQIIRV